MTRLLGLICILATALTAPAWVAAQESQLPLPVGTSPVPAANLNADRAPGVAPPEYRLGPGDGVGIYAYATPEMNRTLVVSGSGELAVPYLAAPLPVSGKTAAEVASELNQALRAQRILVDPRADVVVVQARSHPITVSGAVHQPTIIYAVRPIPLLDAVLRAGGINPDQHGLMVEVSPAPGASTGPDAAASVLRVPFNLIVAHADQDPLLYGGEHVQVLAGGFVYATGNFNKPGAIPIEMNETMTLGKVLALAGGWTPDSDPGKTVVARAGANGQVETQVVDAKAILQNKQRDIPLTANDMVFLPDNGLRGAGMFALKAAVTSSFYALGLIAAH